MKKTITVLFLAVIFIGSARAVELERIVLNNLPKVDLGAAAIVPQAAAAKSDAVKMENKTFKSTAYSSSKDAAKAKDAALQALAEAKIKVKKAEVQHLIFSKNYYAVIVFEAPKQAKIHTKKMGPAPALWSLMQRASEAEKELKAKGKIVLENTSSMEFGAVSINYFCTINYLDLGN